MIASPPSIGIPFLAWCVQLQRYGSMALGGWHAREHRPGYGRRNRDFVTPRSMPKPGREVSGRGQGMRLVAKGAGGHGDGERFASDLWESLVRVIENPAYKRSTALKARAWRMLRSVGAGALRAFISAWNQAFPMPPFPSGPDEPSPIAKAAALRDPALLTEQLVAEQLDAVWHKRVG